MKTKRYVMVIFGFLFLVFARILFAEESFQSKTVKIIGGATTSFFAHEVGHYLMAESLGGKNVRFDSPFAVVWDDGIYGNADKFRVASAGFTAQNVLSEVSLSLQERNNEKSYFTLGILLQNLVEGPLYINDNDDYNDLKNMQKYSDNKLSESEIRTFLAVKSLIDLYRFYHPEQKWAVWTSRSMTCTMVGVTINF